MHLLKENKKTVFIFALCYGQNILKEHKNLCIPWLYGGRKKIGSNYLVNLVVHTDLNMSCKSDELKDTVDYVALLDIVKNQMKIRSNLLENVADRVVTKIYTNSAVRKAVVKIAKLNPPINGDTDEVVIRREKREKSRN